MAKKEPEKPAMCVAPDCTQSSNMTQTGGIYEKAALLFQNHSAASATSGGFGQFSFTYRCVSQDFERVLVCMLAPALISILNHLPQKHSWCTRPSPDYTRPFLATCTLLLVAVRHIAHLTHVMDSCESHLISKSQRDCWYVLGSVLEVGCRGGATRVKVAYFQSLVASVDKEALTIPEVSATYEIPTQRTDLHSSFSLPSKSFEEVHSAFAKTITVSDTTLFSLVAISGVKVVDSADARKGHTCCSSANRLLTTELEQDTKRV